MPAISQLIVWAVTAAAACGPAGPAALRAPRPPVPPAAYRISDVPLVEAHEGWCGPAALAAVLRFHGDDARAAEIADDIYLADRRGALNLDLLVWARRRGYEASAGEGSTVALMQTVVRDRPVICMIRRRGPLAGRNHFIVIRGYEDSGEVWLADTGDDREVRVAAADFERDWSSCGRWMLVVEGKKADSASEAGDGSS